MRIDTLMLAVTLIALSGLSQVMSACDPQSAGNGLAGGGEPRAAPSIRPAAGP
jgi:hypothetical protein